MRQIEEGRGNAESHLSNYNEEAFLSFEIVDSLLQKIPPLASLNTESTSQSVDDVNSVPTESTGFLGLSFRDLPEERLKLSSPADSDSGLPRDGSREEIYLHTNELGENNVLSGRETMHNLPRSFSAKAVMFNSTCQSERKSPLGLFKRMREHITKSKSSQRNPSPGDPSSIGSHRVLCRSLTKHDLSSEVSEKVVENGVGGSIGSDQASSPAQYLHAILKLESKHGAPQYEFVAADGDPEDVLSASTWRSDSAFSWVYTFHRSKKKNREGHGQSPPIIGQMQVSSCLCSQVSTETGASDNSTVTEFVLYDINAQARRSFAEEEEAATFTFVADSSESTPLVVPDKYSYYPLAPADLHPHLEIAAIVTRVPFNELRAREQPQLMCSSSSSASTADQGIEEDCSMSPAAHRVKVVTSSGTHGSPRTVSLLDRWRFGSGGCDCGGWDMACPVLVLDNPCAANAAAAAANAAADCSLIRARQPILLFIQGRKEKMRALSLMAEGEGQYSVDFHAQLSALQAFSICIAVLHSSEAAAFPLGHENRQRLYSSPLKLLLGEEVRLQMEAVEEERRKAKQIPPLFVLDPRFSPIARV